MVFCSSTPVTMLLLVRNPRRWSALVSAIQSSSHEKILQSSHNIHGVHWCAAEVLKSPVLRCHLHLLLLSSVVRAHVDGVRCGCVCLGGLLLLPLATHEFLVP